AKNVPPEKIPVFAAVVSGSSASDISADLRFRAQDVGSTGSVYVFALAPATVVRNAALQKDAHLGLTAKAGQKDTTVACVLAQLSASGQLVAVSTASLQAYVTGVLSAQGQAVTVINGVPAAQIAGATFFVGYGASSTGMLSGGPNRSVATVPGSVQCQPQKPQTGWWWNTAEG